MVPRMGLVLLIYGAVANVRKLSDRFREEGIHHRRVLARISDHAHRVLSFLQLAKSRADEITDLRTLSSGCLST
jgi:hypothetical protein